MMAAQPYVLEEMREIGVKAWEEFFGAYGIEFVGAVEHSEPAPWWRFW